MIVSINDVFVSAVTDGFCLTRDVAFNTEFKNKYEMIELDFYTSDELLQRSSSKQLTNR